MAEKTRLERTERRRWLAFVLATVMMLLTYLLFIYALAAAAGAETLFAGAVLGIALGLVPAVFAVAAFVSQHERAFLATLLASALWLVVTFPIGLGSLPVGLVAGFGAGGVFAFRLNPANTRPSRVLAVILITVYTMVLQRLLPEVGLFAGAPLPFLAILAADIYTERFGQD